MEITAGDEHHFIPLNFDGDIMTLDLRRPTHDEMETFRNLLEKCLMKEREDENCGGETGNGATEEDVVEIISVNLIPVQAWETDLDNVSSQGMSLFSETQAKVPVVESYLLVNIPQASILHELDII